MSRPLEIEVYWSFRSPWSYLATPRLASWKREFLLEVRFRPVYPIAVRSPEFFNSVNPLWFPYFMKDVFRVAEFLELPFQWANPDPIVQIPGDNGRPQTAAEQPFIERLTRLGVLAEEQGAGIEFAEQVAGLIWTTDHWDQGSLLADAARTIGLDLPEMESKLHSDADRLDEIIRQNETAHTAAGHWGVPTMVYEAEPFFGQDRLDVLMWRLLKNGLARR